MAEEDSLDTDKSADATRIPPAPPAPDPGPAPSLPARYRLIAPLGRGGMAMVHRAFDQTLGREVAVKVLLPEAAAAPEGRARFRREAEAIAQIAHPNIINVFDAGPDYLVMELAPGGPVGKVTPEILEKIARGVQAAHERGIVHRDLKPANVLLAAGGEPKVADFGLAHLAGEHTRLTRDGTVFGTPQYMAPEQVQGKVRDVSPRTDVWALGAMLYEAIAGVPAFPGTTAIEVFGKIVHMDPIPPSRLDPRVPAALEVIALKALEKDPARRYADASGLADDLRRWREGNPIVARPPSRWRLLGRRLARRRTAVAAAVAALVMLGLALAYFLPQAGRTRENMRLWYDVSVILGDADLFARSREVERARMRIDEGIKKCREFDTAEAHYFLGRLYHARGDEEEALRQLDGALQLNPRMGEANLERGLIRAERYGRALDRGLWKFAGRIPDDEPLAPEECERAAEAGELRALAIADLSVAQGESAYFRPVDALFGKAELARMRWQWTEAETGFRAVLERDPLYTRASLALAEMAYLRQDFATAESRANEALGRHPGLAAAYRVRSQALFWKMQAAPSAADLLAWRKQILEDAGEAIHLGDPAWAARGNARSQFGDEEGALADFARALEIEPRDALTWNNRGVVRQTRNDLAGAVDDFNRAVTIAPSFGRAWGNLALVHALMGDEPAAAAAARRALEVMPARDARRAQMELLLKTLGGKK